MSSPSDPATTKLDDNEHHDAGETPEKTTNMTSFSSSVNFKLMLLVLMVLQNSSTVLIGRHTRSSVPKEELYVVNHLIFVAELSKFFLALILEYMATNGALWKSLNDNIFANPLDCLKILVPALLYLVQNSLLYTALSNLSAPLFQVTYQGKLVTTALVSVCMLGRHYNAKQWICLVVLSVGVAIVVLGEQQKKQEEDRDDKPTQSLSLGLTAVTIACMSSALAGVYFEKVLKKKDSATNQQPVSLWMRNVQLAFFSLVIAWCQGMYESHKNGSSSSSSDVPYLHGFTVWVWILMALQAGGGMLVAAVIKYADNVLKGLATGVSVVVATSCSMVLFGTPLSTQFSIGATMILTSVYLFSNNVPHFCKLMTKKQEKNEDEEDSVEMRNPLVLPK